ncbi:MAG: BMA_0021/BMA_0022 family TOMM bacteriocin [Proteobacteria bacterium]|nr:BMA_0021/BMA_0022 family TOMM bacteriocin [Pseudomonadota bacterium]
MADTDKKTLPKTQATRPNISDHSGPDDSNKPEITINPDGHGLKIEGQRKGPFNAQPTPSENILSDMESFKAWHYAWLRAVALAWSDDKLRADLLEDPVDFFLVHCNYRVPSGLKLFVYEADLDSEGKVNESVYGTFPPGWDAENNIWYLEDSIVAMYLPPTPDFKDQAVALAAYDATARSYPFTTC